MATKEEIQEKLTRYNPGGFPKITSTNAVPPPTPDGSVFGAVFRQENTIGNVINRFGNSMPAGEATPGFEPIRYIPAQYYEFADRYASLVNQEQVEWLSDQIAQEQRDKAIIAGNPWRSFFANMASSVVDLPGYLLPGGVIYNNATRGLNVARSAMSVAGANFLAQSISEGVLQNTQYSRSVDESIMNVFSAALVGAAMGGMSGALIPRKIAKAAVEEASDIYANGSPTRLIEFNDDGKFVITPNPKGTQPPRPPMDSNLGDIPPSGPGIPGAPIAGEPIVKMGDAWEQTNQSNDVGFFRDIKSSSNPMMDYDALKESASIANLPEIAVKAVATNPAISLKTSPFGTARALVDNMVESSFGTNATDLDLVAKSRNLETRIHASHFQYMRAILDLEDIALEQRGLSRGLLKRTGEYMDAVTKNKELPGKPLEQFYQEVSVAIRNNDLTGDPYVLRAAKHAQEKILNPLRDEAIRLGLLPKNVSVQTANSYLMRIWNRPAIIENRAGFEALLYEYYVAVNDALKVTLPKVEGFNLATKRATGLLAANEKMRAQVDESLATVATDKSTLATTNKEITLTDARIRQTNDVIVSKKEYLNSERTNTELDIKDVKDESQSFIKSETERLTTDISFLQDKKAKALRGAVQQGKTASFVDRLTRRYDKDIVAAQKELDNVTRKTTREAAKEVAALNKKIQRVTKEVELEITKLKSELVDYKSKKTELTKQSSKLQKNIESLNKKIDELRVTLKSQPDEVLNRAIELLQAEIEGMKWQEIMGQRAAHLLDTDGNWRAIQNNDELRANVTQTMENILSLGDDRLLNPLLRGVVTGKTSPLMNRELLMPDNMAQPFLVNDSITILERYVKSMSPLVEGSAFAQERGFADIATARAEMKRAIRDEWEFRTRNASPEDAVKLEKRLKKDLKNVDAIWEILLGVYGSAPNSDNVWAKIARAFREWNVMRLMGSVTLASIPDLGTMALRHGPYALIHEGILPLLKSKAFREMTKDDLQAIGFACNTLLGLRIKNYADTSDLIVARGKYGKVLDAVKQGFGNVTLVNQWSDMVEEIAGALSNNFILKRIDLFYKTGKISDADLKRLARVGISKEDFSYIHEQWKLYGGIEEGAYFANTGMWDISSAEKSNAFRKYREAIITEIRSMLVRPTIQDKPLAMYTELGKTAFQFKSFGFAATNKILMSGLQNRDDINTLTGLVTLLSLGALGYAATSLARGNEPDLSFVNLSKESIDRSGILGIFSEYYNIAAKMGVIPGQGASRYRTRGKFGAVGGPTVGAVEDVAAFIAKITETMGGKPLTTKDVDVMLRLMPYQNLFYAHQLSRTAARKVAVQLGAREVPERRRSDR